MALTSTVIQIYLECRLSTGFPTIHPECEASLKILEHRRYEVRRVGGYAAIEQGRNQLATDSLRNGCDEMLWIGADIGCHPDSIEKLRSHDIRLVSGIYPKKGQRALACHVTTGTVSLTVVDVRPLPRTELAFATILRLVLAHPNPFDFSPMREIKGRFLDLKVLREWPSE